jgi:hypothetical protein
MNELPAQWLPIGLVHLDAISQERVRAYAEEYARAALAAQPGAVGEWKLVPVEPTPEMLKAGINAFQRSYSEADILSDWRECFKAMLAAAPTEAKQPPCPVCKGSQSFAPGYACTACCGTGLDPDGTEAKPAQDAVNAEQTIAALRAENEQLRRDMGAMVREDVDCALAAATQDAFQPAANWLLNNVEHCDAGELAHRLVISPEYAIRLERAAISAKKGG